MVINTCAKFGMPMSKSKDELVHTKIHVYNIKFDVEAKDQGHTEVTNLCDTCTRYGMTVNKQKAMAQTQSHEKDIEVNVPDTSSHGDGPMCQIW